LKVILASDFLQVNGNCYKLFQIKGPITVYVSLEDAKMEPFGLQIKHVFHGGRIQNCI
jgi:hypothetical protein